MTEGRQTAIRALLNNRVVRVSLKAALGAVAVCAAAFGALVAYNAFDADLSADAKALLAPPPMGKVDEKNGYIAFLGLVAPKGQDQLDWGRKAAAAFAAQATPGFNPGPEWKEATREHFKAPADRNKWCIPDCLSEVRRDADAVAKRLADPDNVELLARYRKMRDAPEFTEIYMGSRSIYTPRGYASLHAGSTLALAEGASKANAGDLEALVAELEREVAFHRKLIEGGRTLITVMAGESSLARDLLVISELLRTDWDKHAAFDTRLGKLTRPQVSAKSLHPAFRFAAHESASWAQYWRELLRANSGVPTPEHGWQLTENWTLALFIKPNETVNLVASIMKIEESIADVSAGRFDQEASAIRTAHDALLERPWYAEASNPVGKGVAEVANSRLAGYAARMNDLQALERMVDLQVTLSLRGSVETAAIAEFVASEGAKAQRDPYTGKPFAFDPATRLLSFEPRAKDRWKEMTKRHGGKVAITL